METKDDLCNICQKYFIFYKFICKMYKSEFSDMKTCRLTYGLAFRVTDSVNH